MNFLPLIESKREGKILSSPQINDIVSACVSGQIPDYQMAAFLMAIYFRGLNDAELLALTLAMRDSGEILEFPKDKRLVVDCDFAGGVGDKVPLALAPVLACLGFRVPMITGRGLGITGGTLDKLDSIPGFKSALTPARIVEIVQSVGCAICGQTDRIAPADKALHSLRDVTGTVPSIQLIVASLISRKLAENLDALVLNVEFGTGAFMLTHANARLLGRELIGLAKQCGLNPDIIVSNMDTPLGRAAGNWLEVKETFTCLQPGRLSPQFADIYALILNCAAQLLVQTRREKTLVAGRQLAEECIVSGDARRKFEEMLAAQGANLDAFNRKLALDRTAPIVVELKAPKTGIVWRCDARAVGEAIRELGGNRLAKDAPINSDVGIDRLAKPGDEVKAGSPLVRVHAANSKQAAAAIARLQPAFDIGIRKPDLTPLIASRVQL